MDVELYPITSEGSIIEAFRFGNAHIAFMDGAAAWVGWQQYGLEAKVAADARRKIQMVVLDDDNAHTSR